MKRGGWLNRLTPLRPNRRLRRNRTPLSTAHVVSPEERRARKLVGDRSGGICELCTRPATDWAHRKRRSQGGPWCPSNGLHLCRRHHQLVDDPLQPSPRSMGWALKSYEDPLTTPCYLPRHGRVLLRADGGVTPCDPPDHPESAA